MAAGAIIRRHPPEASDNCSFDPSPYLNGRGNAVRKSFQGFMRAVKDTLDPERKQSAQNAIHKVYGSYYVQSGSPSQVTKTVMGEESGITGGYLVPMDYSTALLRTVVEESFFLPRCTRVPMGSREASCPTYQTRGASGTTGVPTFFGNMVYKWGSSQAPQETEPLFDQVNLTAWDLLGYSTVSNDFLMDAGEEAEAAIVHMFGKAAAWFLEYAFLMGTGSAQQMPTGINGCPAQKLVARTTTKIVTIADIANMAAALLPFSWGNAIWMCHPTILITLLQLAQYQISVTNVAPASGLVGYLIGNPLYVTDKLPPPGTGVNGDIVLVDPSLYAWGVRQEVVVDVSPHPAFKTNQTDFRVWLRADGKPQVSGPITLQDQATVVSPFVVLQGK